MAYLRLLRIQRDNDRVQLHRALCRWKSTAELMLIDRRYSTQVDIFYQQIDLMLNRFRTIKIPEYLANANKIRGKTLSELRKLLAELQNLCLKEEARGSHKWVYIPGGTAYAAPKGNWVGDKEEEEEWTISEIKSQKETEDSTGGYLVLEDLESKPSLLHETASEFKERLRSLTPSPSTRLNTFLTSRKRLSRSPVSRVSASLMNAGFSPGRSRASFDEEFNNIDRSLSEINMHEWEPRYGHGTSLLTTPAKTMRRRSPRPSPGGGGSGIRRGQMRLPPPTERYDAEEQMAREVQRQRMQTGKPGDGYLPTFLSDGAL